METASVDTNCAILTSAASTARSRRKHHSTPRIRHWLEDVIEAGRRLSPRKSRQSVSAPTPQSPESTLSPSLDFLLDFKNSTAFGEFRLSDSFSQISTALNSKPSLEKLGTASSDKDAGTTDTSETWSFGNADAETLKIFPRIESINERRHTRPMTIDVHPSPYKTRYTLDKDKHEKVAELKQKLRHNQVNAAATTAAVAPVAPKSPVKVDYIYGFPYLHADTAVVPALIPETPESPVSDGPLPVGIPAAFKHRAPITMTTSRGVEPVVLPPMPDNANKLRLASARMAKKSERMLQAAVAIRAQQAKGIVIIPSSRQQQRRVLSEAKQVGGGKFRLASVNCSRPTVVAAPTKLPALPVRPAIKIAKDAGYVGAYRSSGDDLTITTTTATATADFDAATASPVPAKKIKKTVTFFEGYDSSDSASQSSVTSKSSGASAPRHRLSFVPSGRVQRKWSGGRYISRFA